MSALANYIRRQMDALGKNQAEIAALAGITESTLSNILIKEKILPRPNTIKGLARALENVFSSTCRSLHHA